MPKYRRKSVDQRNKEKRLRRQDQPAGEPFDSNSHQVDNKTPLSSASPPSQGAGHRSRKSASISSSQGHESDQSSLYQPAGGPFDANPHQVDNKIPLSSASPPSQGAGHRSRKSASISSSQGHESDQSSLYQPAGGPFDANPHQVDNKTPLSSASPPSQGAGHRSRKSASISSSQGHESDQSSLYQPTGGPFDANPHQVDNKTPLSSASPPSQGAGHRSRKSASISSSQGHESGQSSLYQPAGGPFDANPHQVDNITPLSSSSQHSHGDAQSLNQNRELNPTEWFWNYLDQQDMFRQQTQMSRKRAGKITEHKDSMKKRKIVSQEAFRKQIARSKQSDTAVILVRERDAKRKKERRKDKYYRTAEQEKDTERHIEVRKDGAFKHKEKERETKLRTEKRKDKTYRTAEQMKNTERHIEVRKDSTFKHKEKERETKLRTEKRKDKNYRTAEQEKDTERHVEVRKDGAFKHKEKERETKLRTEKRKDKNYRTAEQEKDTERHVEVRKDGAFKHKEKERETKLRTEKRKDKNYRTAEQEKDTERHVEVRKDGAFKHKEKERETKLRTEKRKDKNYRTAEQEKDTERHVEVRKDGAFKHKEKERETKLRTEKREDKNYRTAEQEKDTERHVEVRKDGAFKHKEKERETKLRTEKRKDKNYRTAEREREKLNKSEKRQSKSSRTLNDVIETFHNKVSEGPIYNCTSCFQLWFKHSVLPFPNSLRTSNNHNIKELIQMCPMNIGIQGKLWLCKTCYNYFRRGKMPPMSIMNKMEFPASCILQELNPLEQTLLAVILPFMKIHQAPRGKQKKLLGNMVLVPSDVDSTVTQLPRLQSNTGTIKAKLKLRLRYIHHVYALNIRPHLVRSAAKYLTSAPLYKQYVQFDDSWSEEIVDDDSSEEEDNEQHTSSDKQGTKDKVEGSDDEWDEVDEGEKMSGEADTMLTAPDYIEPGERDKVYNFAPAEGGAPLSVFLQPDCEELAFPGIFCGHKRPSNEDRTVRVTYGDIVKSELRNADRRAASNIENLFFKTKKIQMKTLIDQGQLALRKVKIQDQQLTVKDVTGEAVQSLIFHDKAYKFLANIRGSPPYFEKASKDLFAMIRQLGPATFFITLSAAESRWLHLLRILGTVVDHRKYTDQELEDMTWDEKCRLIQSDPITCARVFDHSVSAFLSTFIHSECHPLSEVQDFFYRVEYQQRGSPHIHMMVWCKDSPTFGKDSDEEICEFIDKFITCNSITDKTNLTELIGLQNHRHSHTCKKKREKVCRFGFPKPPLEKTAILYPLEEDIPRKVKEELRKKYKCIQTFLNEHENDLDISYKDFLDLLKMTEEEYVKAIRSTLKSPTVFLKRKVCEPRMNNYNENILLAWRANIDIQFVLDVYACATYVASYVTKSQRGMSELLRQASKEVQSGNLNLKEQIRTVGNKFLNAVEISAQEAAYICLQLPMKRASRKVVFVNTSPPSARVSLLKPQGILNKMKEDDDDIECSNDLTRYATRPTSMENMCLAEFISQYDRISKDDKQIQVSLAKTMNLRESSEINNDDEDKNTDLEEEAVTTSLDQQYRKRKIGNILRPVHFNPDTDTELYYRELIVLYYPWRDEDALKDENESFQQKYITLRDEISKQREIYEPFAAAVDEASRLILESDDIDETWDQLAPQAEHAESEDRHNTEKPVDAGIEDYDIGQDVGLPISNVEEDLHSYNEMSDEDYRNHMQKLNRTQIAFVYDIVRHLKSSNEPIYRFLSGGAGVGKSYVTSALYQTALKYLNKKEGDNFTARKLLLLAPTGKAAYHIKGTTIHCGLKIPPNQKLEHKPLSASSLNSLRNEIGSVSLVFIDEISMVGFKMMNCIHQRLMEIKQSPKPFGGVSIIAVGDLFQLKPVMDSYIFSSPKSGYLPLATNLWTDLFSMVELTQIMRQADHKNFAELLNRLREGNQTQQDIDTLKERQLSIPQTDIHYPSTSVHLYATNERVNAFNSTVILRTDTPKSLVTAKDRLVGSTPPSMQQKILQNFKNSSQTKQLSNTVELAEGVIYDLTVNVDTSDGLINGASCTVKKLSLPTGETQPKGIVWVQFHDENIGRALRNSSKHLYRGNVNRNWTPIEPIVKQCTAGHKGQAQIQRLQYPLRPAHAKTIHRSQGDTMDSAVIDMTTKRKIEHIHYVAVSRLKSLDGLHIINLEENKIAVSTDVQREMERLRSIPQQTSSTLSLSSNEGNLKIVYLNSRSLHRHLPDIKCDININVSDVAIFSETRLCERDSQDATSLTSHPYQYRFDGSCAGDNRPYHGLNIYSKQELIVIDQSKRNNIEIVLAETNMGISVIAVYKPPTVSSTALCKNLKELHTKRLFHESLILGDFNIDWNEDSSQRKQLKKCLCDDLGYKQNIEGPTTDRQTRIDLIFSRLHQPITTGTAEVYFSDHKIVWASC